MSHKGTGSISIDKKVYTDFLAQHAPLALIENATVVFGIPRETPSGIEINYAFDSDGDPTKWENKPLAVREHEASATLGVPAKRVRKPKTPE